ncbi:MAG TPA: iron-sulfur cluster insertion protein ErpA [Anaeromyxobacteraceae bacterium]|nr:iron-sulfur cluster insertion protein ErpA [Anaeromyxobacteraceae bacterium]
MDATTLTAPAATDLGMDNFIVLTDKAVEMVKDAMQREGLAGYGIRVGVMGGGCAGFQYSMDFEQNAKEGDITVEQNGVKLYVDSMSSMYLQGVTIDYVVGLQGAGFKFNNPNAKNTCGCGSSFST